MTKTLGQYELKKTLGKGGMSTVYLAYDPNLERDVALKALPSYFAHEPEFSARFEREAKTISSLEHAAIVPIYDYGEEEMVPFLVMRLMEGGSLADRLKDRPISLGEAGTVLTRIAGALDKAHSRGILHRDIKPGNILFDEDGAAFLADFGIVKLAASSTTFTQTGSTLGTPAYMSPEQARGKEELDGRTDIYSLGVVLYEMLTGDIPYEADTAMGQAMMHVLEPLPNILAANSDLPVGAQTIIDKAMAKDREERYNTASELAGAVSSLARETEAPAVEEVIGEAEPEPVVVEAETPQVEVVGEPEPKLPVEVPAPPPDAEAAEPEPEQAVAAELPAEPEVEEPEPSPVGEVIEAETEPVEVELTPEPVAEPVEPEPVLAVSEPEAFAAVEPPSERPGPLAGLPPWAPFALGGVVLVAILGVIFIFGGGNTPGATEVPWTPTLTPEDSAIEVEDVTRTAEALAQVVDPTATPSPTNTRVPPTATVTPTPSKTPRPTATPTKRVPPGLYVRINNISILNNRYVVFYETFEYTEALPNATHVHFYFDSVDEANAGSPGSGPWFLYGGPRPFQEYSVSSRPAGAEQMCARVANPDHSIIPGSGNCFDLPESPDETAINLLVDFAPDWQGTGCDSTGCTEIIDGDMKFSFDRINPDLENRYSSWLSVDLLSDGIYQAKAVIESLGDQPPDEAARSDIGIELVLFYGEDPTKRQSIYLDYRLDSSAISGYCPDPEGENCPESSTDVDPLGDGDVVEMEIDILEGNAIFSVNGSEINNVNVGFPTYDLLGVELAIDSDYEGTIVTFYDVLFSPAP